MQRDAVQPTSSIQTKPAGNPNRPVCTQTRITGSRFARRLCRTAAGADADREKQQDELREYQQFGASDPPAGDLVGPSGATISPN